MAFLDKFGETVNSVSSKTKNAFEASTLNQQLKLDEDGLKKCYAELGKAYYERDKFDIPADFQHLYRAIEEAKNSVKYTSKRLSEVKGIKFCPSCSAEMSKTARFCPKCGASCGDAAEEETANSNVNSGTQTGKCQKCGAKLKTGAAFCNSCGAKVE